MFARSIEAEHGPVQIGLIRRRTPPSLCDTSPGSEAELVGPRPSSSPAKLGEYTGGERGFVVGKAPRFNKQSIAPHLTGRHTGQASLVPLPGRPPGSVRETTR